MSDLVCIELNDMRHKENKLWLSSRGEILYGSRRDNLIFPDILEIQGVLPRITLRDLRAVFRAGLEMGRGVDKF